MKIINKNINLHEFFEKIATGKALLMLDYDGTLAPLIVERMQAFPYPGVQDRLAEFMKMDKTRTVIVSGRRLSDLEKLLGISQGLELWGSHGLERKLPNGKIVRAQVDPKIHEGLEKGKNICQEHIPSHFFEIKPYSIALHWRGMNQSDKLHKIDLIEPQWKHIAETHDLEVHPFDQGIELRPKNRHKGEVVNELLKERFEAIAFLGDDITDEDAFAALGEKGLKVLVREQFRPTLADICIIPPNELLAFLDQWIGSHERK